MLTEQEVVESVSGAIKRGGEMYFDREASLRLIAPCDAAEFAVTGIEVFRLSEDATEPDPALIADFSTLLNDSSWPEITMAANRAAEEFVRKAPSGRYFNFVLSRRSLDPQS